MTNTTPHGQVPEALRIADEFRECLECDAIPSIIDIEKAEAEFRRLHAENERLSCLCDKWNSECDEFREDNKRLAAALVETQQECAALARTVMLDQVSFDRKPD